MGSNDEPAIGIRDLWVRRGGKPVLPGISLAIRRGVVTGLLGPSGSGKTTLMRAIVGVQIVERGDVSVLGRSAGAADLREPRRLLEQTRTDTLERAFLALAEAR